PFQIIPKSFEWKMRGDCLDAAAIQLLPELIGRKLVGAGQFDILNAKSFHFIEGAGHIFIELVAQTIELQPNWAPEHRARATIAGALATGHQECSNKNAG